MGPARAIAAQYSKPSPLAPDSITFTHVAFPHRQQQNIKDISAGASH